MLQELFHIPLPHFLQNLFHVTYLPVYGYGAMLVIGFLLAAQLAKYLARRCGLDGELFVNAGLLALITGVIGARLSHVLESLADPSNTEFARNGKDFFWDNFKAMLNVSSGGLTFYGGFLLATPVLIWYAIRKKVPLLTGMDIMAPCIMIGLAFGRIGCYLNGCCYGEECNVSWGAAFPYGSNAFVEQFEKNEIDVPPQLLKKEPSGRIRLLTKGEIHGNPDLERLADSLRAKPVHPTELYSAFNAFFIAAILLVFFSVTSAPGRVFALMLMLKGASRYILEMIRVEPPVWFEQTLKLSFSMGLSLALIALGVFMWWMCGRLRNRAATHRLAVATA
jgi:phosphatidylglycerol:prolipoprotein diacylglycerol transferase